MLRCILALTVLAAPCACRAETKVPRANCVLLSPAPSRIEGTTQCRMQANVTVNVDGAYAFSKSGTYPVLVTEFYKGKLPQATWFASLAMVQPELFAENLRFIVGWDIAPGTYRGPRRYTLTAERPKVEGLSSPLRSDGFVQITSLVKEDLGVFKFGTLLEPCTLVVRQKVASGNLRCPKLADERGKEVSLALRWEPAK